MTNFDFKNFNTGKTIFYCKIEMNYWSFGSFILDKIEMSEKTFDITLVDQKDRKYKITGEKSDTVVFENQEELNTFILNLKEGKETFDPYSW